jgi:hypothetical protein
MTIYIKTATLSYTSKTNGTPTINPVTGRPQFTTTGVIETVDVSLEQRNVAGSLSEMAGKDISGIPLAGRLLPIGAIAPTWLRADVECDLEMLSGIKGKFYILQTITSRFGLESVFGHRISGIFVQRSTH